jgi:broad-specificity NMP kinase
MVMDRRTIVIVSGLPRSGTSMMMKMLEAGGLEVLTDRLREADEDNPKGYYEFERVKQLEHDKSWLPKAEGKVVKIISQLLHHLPSDYAYKVVFMRRRMEEILASQERMLVRRGEEGGKISDDKLAALFRQHLERVQGWLDAQPNFDVTYVSYNQVLENPRDEAERIDAFLDEPLDVERMATVVDPSLYRQRTE